MASGFTALLVGILAVWRITHFLQVEDGPWHVLLGLRRFVRARGWRGPFECFYCLSLWVAPIVALCVGREWIYRALLWPALSGGAILLERATSAAEEPTASFHEDTEEEHVLRKV
jgi:hypothetical protein